MSVNQSADAAVIGGGIVGLAHALALLKKGFRVVLFEREHFAIGASVRNFGLLWPVGQEQGNGLRRALRSREIWNEVSREAGVWLNPCGSLQLAYHDDEWDVLNEFAESAKSSEYKISLLSPNQASLQSMAIKTHQLKGAMSSSTEATVNPREAIRRIPGWLSEKYNLILRFGTLVKAVEPGLVHTAAESWKVDKVFVCSGADFETLYPEVYEQQEMYKCKLQMMKGVTSGNVDIGPSLCAGLTLLHYPAFRNCTTLAKVRDRYDQHSPDYKTHGVHVLLSQNNYGDWIIGDSHHYGKTLEPFDAESVNRLILNYLQLFVDTSKVQITERWNGTYSKTKDGNILIMQPHRDVTIVNGLGGAGMTLSFGLAEELVAAL
jgi:D-hydroxyproline dehydrogenase subunit beta